MIARALLCVLLVAGACGKEAPRPPPTELELIDAALARGAAYLAARQEADGAIRSPTYAAFRDGYALTGLATLALLQAPGDAAARARPRAVAFLTTLVDARGQLRLPPPAYPTYAMALAVLVLNAPGHEAHRGVRDALRAELRGRQLGPELGWRPDDASFGGWGYYPIVPRRPAGDIADDLLSSNLSATLLVVGALTLGGVPADDPALVLARGFVERCQGADGGFFFSPAVPDANKAGALDDGAFRSYGSMTADGVRALLRLGVPPDDPRVVRAAAWLERRFDAETNPGDFPPIAEVRRASAYYYWTWTAAHALRALGRPPATWAPALAAALRRRQLADGSWKNPASEMREDDPVVATAFAMASLAVTRAVLAGEHRTHAGWK